MRNLNFDWPRSHNLLIIQLTRVLFSVFLLPAFFYLLTSLQREEWSRAELHSIQSAASTNGREAKWSPEHMALCWQSSQTGSAWATRNILKRTRHMCFRKKIEVFHNKTGQSEIQVLYKILIKNWFYPSTWIYNMFPRWISYLSIIQTRNINETNKAFKNGTEAKMYVNTRWLWWKQGRQGKQPLSKCLLLESWMKQFLQLQSG